jgi:hypothetical protein
VSMSNEIDFFAELDEKPKSFNDEIREYVREQMAPNPITATIAESFDVLMHYSRIALSADSGCQFDTVGSVAILGAGADYDLLFCSSTPLARLSIEDAMLAQGFIEEGEGYPQDEFTSLRFNEVNVLVTDDPEFFDNWKRSVAVCKLVRDEFGSIDRPLRVAIHQEIMDNRERRISA